MMGKDAFETAESWHKGGGVGLQEAAHTSAIFGGDLPNVLSWMWLVSWFMLFCGIMCIVLLIMGIFFMHYYTHAHATETGRMWGVGCFLFAPLLVSFGLGTYALVSYVAAPFENIGGDAGVVSCVADALGPVGDVLGAGFKVTWSGPSYCFLIACLACVFTWAPFLVLSEFGKVSPWEKARGLDEWGYARDQYGGGYGGGYGAAGYDQAGGQQGAYGYGGTQPQQGQPLPPQPWGQHQMPTPGPAQPQGGYQQQPGWQPAW